MPTNLYGPGDNFHPENSHVLPGLMRRFHEAKEAGAPKVAVWGSGRPRREFMHVDDCARALVFLLETYSDAQHVNVGTGEDISIGEIAKLVARVVGYEGAITFDASKPDGTPRKLMDVSRLRHMGFAPQISLAEGLESTYAWFRDSLAADTSRLRGMS
jgi:GDP-L-fucose synthase